MLKIRLKRLGKKHDPHYRIVIMPARSKRDGKAVEYIGYYNPRTKEINLKKERAEYWLSVGAQPTETVHSILAKHKLVERKPLKKEPVKKSKKEQSKKETKQKKGESKKVEKKKEDKKSAKKDIKKEDKK